MNKTICALGFFDGVHTGHAALLSACRHLAEKQGCRCAVVTFTSHPDTLVLGEPPRLINTPADRRRLLRSQFHMDNVIELPFDEAMRAMLWEDFLTMLRREYQAAGFVCGEDFRFGSRGAGNAVLLRQYCTENSLACAVVPEQFLDNVRISSTYIRKQLETGDMATAVRFLGHPHILTGTVVPGKKLGRTLGIPTANLSYPEGLVMPRFGVYACKAWVEGAVYPAVTNIGTRPTVEGENITVEPWILDYSGDLYGKQITLGFYRFLRPEQKFDSLEALKAAILQDAEQTRTLLTQ